MEIFKQFGVNPVLLIAQIINFLIILYLLKKFFYKQILDVLKKREEEIKKGLQSAEEGNLLLQKAKEEEQKILSKASIQAEKIIKNAKEQSSELKKDLEEKTKERIEKMLLDANHEIERKTLETEKKLSDNILKIAISVLEKTIPSLLNKKEQDEIMKRAIQKISKRI